MSSSPQPAGDSRPPANGKPGPASGPLTRLVEEIGRAAAAGWSQTARMVVLLTATAMAIALILAVTR
jgi:hypothetical protein